MLASAKERTKDMFETLAVFQPAMFWLKADADSNICERTHKCKQATTTERTGNQSVLEHAADGANDARRCARAVRRAQSINSSTSLRTPAESVRAVQGTVQHRTKAQDTLPRLDVS